MYCKQFLVILIVLFGIPAEEKKNLPCIANLDITNGVYWPELDDGICSASVPGCINSNGVLEIRCCFNGQPSGLDCIEKDTLRDPRCLGNMRSTVGNVTLNFCFEVVNNTTYPYNCMSRTGRMIDVNETILTTIGGNDSGIWLPAEKFTNSYRWSTINPSYMELVERTPVYKVFESCLILWKGEYKSVSCKERHHGICLDFPFIVHPWSKNDLDALLSDIKDICSRSLNDYLDFCSYFRQGYNMNLIYFSSRSYAEEPYIILQKSNLRFILQIRIKEPPLSGETVYVHVALSQTDWDIFKNTSFPLSYFSSKDKDIYVSPEVIITVSGEQNRIEINKKSLNNIKWTQKEEYTRYIFCFLGDLETDDLKKFEVLEEYKTETDGVYWCDAFDHDLNIIRSNIITLGNRSIPNFISEMVLYLDNMVPCDYSRIKNTIIEWFSSNKGDRHFHFEIKTIVYECDFENSTKVEITVHWYPRRELQYIDEIEEGYFSLNALINEISKKNLNISTKFLRHSNYCLKETTLIGNFSFVWPTTPANSNAVPFPACYKNRHTDIFSRYCNRTQQFGSYWAPTENCDPDVNVTKLLQEIYKSGFLSKSGILNNLNMVLLQYKDQFDVPDVRLLSDNIKQLRGAPLDEDVGLRNLSSVVNNLYLIKSEILKKSQQRFQTTDSIINSSDALYFRTNGSQTLAEKNHCYYTINFTENPSAKGIILNISDNFHGIKLLKSDTELFEFDETGLFEAAIYLDNQSSAIVQSKNLVKFSIFFEDYLFDFNHPSATTRTIFKILLPDEIKEPLISILTVRNHRQEEICACWKYANRIANISESKWYRTPKFEFDNHSFCIFESNSYCAVFLSDKEVTQSYLTNFLAKSEHFDEFFQDPISFTKAVYQVIRKYYPTSVTTLSYYIKQISKQNIKAKMIEFEIEWIPVSPKNKIEEIEEEFAALKKSFEEALKRIVEGGVVENLDLQYMRHKSLCMRNVYGSNPDSKFEFRTTPQNKTTVSTPACFTSDGTLYQRKCLGNPDSGAYWEEIEEKYCYSHVTENLEYIYDHFSSNDADIVLNDLVLITEELQSDFNSNDISLLSDILLLISDTANYQNLNISRVSTLINNLQSMNKDVLKQSQVHYNATDKILDSLDRIFWTSQVTKDLKSRFILWELKNLNESFGLILQRIGNENKISIVEKEYDNFNFLDKYENFKAAVFFENFDYNDSIIVSIFLEDVLFVDSKWEHDVSLIFGILLPKRNGSITPPGIIKLVFETGKGEDKACAFWEYGRKNEIDLKGSWMNESEPANMSKYSICKFNHTTHFAMLINEGDKNPKYLEFITNVGCLLSIIGLLGILATGIIFERWRKNLGNIILINFVSTVAIQIFLYYFSGYIHNIINERESCILVGALLHYAVISEFCWMLIIAILQFKRLVEVFASPPKFVLLKSFLIGWGVPLIPVLWLLLIDPANYTKSITGLCYPSRYGLYMGVWLPIFSIILINLAIFSYIMFNICKRNTDCIESVSNEVIFQWRLAVLLFFMLGLTWIFALMSELILKDIFAYLFCITSTLQGFIMFLFFIVFNERTRLLYSMWFTKILKK